MTKHIPQLKTCMLLMLVSQSAFASLIGDTITIDATWNNAPLGPQTLFSGDVVVNGDPEVSVPNFIGGGSEFFIDFIGDDFFTVGMDFGDLAPWPTDVTIAMTGLDWVDGPGALDSVVQTETRRINAAGDTVVAAIGFLDLISFTDNSITLNSSAEFDFGAGVFADFNYTASHDDNGDNGGPIDVPEPSLLALLGVGLAGLGLARRTRRGSKMRTG